MLKTKKIDVISYLNLWRQFSTTNVVLDGKFYQSRNLYKIELNNKPIAIFCINQGPDFRFEQVLNQEYSSSDFKEPGKSLMEVVGFTIEKRFRGGLISILCWHQIYRKLMATEGHYLIVGTVEPSILDLYQLSGHQPIKSYAIQYAGVSKTAWQFKVAKEDLASSLRKVAKNKLFRSKKRPKKYPVHDVESQAPSAPNHARAE